MTEKAQIGGHMAQGGPRTALLWIVDTSARLALTEKGQAGESGQK